MTTTPLIAVGVLRRADGTIRVGSDSDEAEVNIWLDPDVAMTLGRPDRVDPRARRQLIFFANPAHVECERCYVPACRASISATCFPCRMPTAGARRCPRQVKKDHHDQSRHDP